MATRIPKQVTGRHAIPFSWLPPHYDGARKVDAILDYAATLDSVYEMADAIATSNGIAPIVAVKQVCAAEGWHVLAIHQVIIAERIS